MASLGPVEDWGAYKATGGARCPVVKTREDIAFRGIGTSEAEIRQFRKFIVESHEEHHQLLTGSGDFLVSVCSGTLYFMCKSIASQSRRFANVLKSWD